MEISAATVKKLRDATGAGMMDCKKALVQANGDFAQAERLLKEMGLAAVAKRSGRATDNGRVFIKTDNKRAVMLEINCETDFVARNQDFITLGEALCNDALTKGYTTVNAELEEQVQHLSGIIKENMKLRRLVVFDVPKGAYVAQYIHGEGSMGVMVLLKATKEATFQDARAQELANDLALHVAAFNPLYLSVNDVDAAYKDEQMAIFKAQVASMDKPEKVLAGIVQGKMKKHLGEICLLQQPFVKDEQQSVEAVVKALAKELDDTISVSNYAYYKVGVEE